MKTVTILAQDPGVANFGYAVLRFNFGRKTNYKILKFGRQLSTIHDLKQNLKGQILSFQSIIGGLDSEFAPDALIAERYQSRRMGGTTIECVNFMLGVTSLMFVDRKMRFIPASQWKNAAARSKFWFDDLYQELKPLKITPHAVDAVCIGLYAASFITGQTPYQFTSVEELSSKLKRSKHVDLGSPRPKRVKKKRPKKRGAG